MSMVLALLHPEQRLDQDLSTSLWQPPLPFPEGPWVAQMIRSWQRGAGVLPVRMGMTQSEYTDFCRHYLLGWPPLESPSQAYARAQPLREGERQELIALLLAHAPPDIPNRRWFANILASASLGDNHLWQDLGLSNRKQLSALMVYAFPALARKNVGDMKWKKFFYQQMCQAEGLRLCRSPSCAVCVDRDACFGPEE